MEGSGNPESMERLRILEKSNDGFVIAEEDLRLRGAGDILGTEQSGLPPLRVADLYRDADLISVAAAEAERILSGDPALAAPEHQSLRHLCESHASRIGLTMG
jgi:ATP-dependent DNA helicase RecG